VLKVKTNLYRFQIRDMDYQYHMHEKDFQEST